MAGIYVHIPFCKKACHYCDFHFSTSLKNKEELVKALCKEIELRMGYSGTKDISTIYFGGGTPSLLSKDELHTILQTIRSNFNVALDAEITLEANPDDLSKEKIHELKTAGINRLSIGIQSFFDEHLLLMNRSHTAQQAIEAVTNAQKAGIQNITIDLIYGLPDLSQEKWKANLEKAFSLNVPHISAYCLTVEKKTALDHMVQKKLVALPNDAETTEQLFTLIEESAKHGFIHYEISNFGKEGMYSRHNSNYWKNESYLGIGPSAHSYNGSSRQWNISNNALYIKGIEADEQVFEMENLTEADKFNEYVMTGLRTIWGIDLSYIGSSFGEKVLQELVEDTKPYIEEGFMLQNKENVTLTRKGKLIADKIASDLFI